MRTIITTVGTSLLTNFRKAKEGGEPVEQALINYLRNTQPEHASAETNSLHRLLREGDGIAFLHSMTDDGRLCADCLSRHFNRMGHASRPLSIPDLSYQESRFKMRGLRSLVGSIIKLINAERLRGNEVVINATGGFKAEIAYATLIGLLFDVPVYYIHEAFMDIIEMPPTPIDWHYAMLVEHEEFFEWIDEEPRSTGETDLRLKRLPPKIRFLLSEEEGFTYLSPAGEAFFKAYQKQVADHAGTPIYLSEKAQRSLDIASPSERKILEKAIAKLRVPAFRCSGSEPKYNSDCLVYPQGHCPERIFYYEHEDGAVYVCALTFSHDDYERMLAKDGVWRKDYAGYRKMGRGG